MATIVGRPAKHANFLVAKYAAQAALAVFVGVCITGAVLVLPHSLALTTRILASGLVLLVCCLIARVKSQEASRAAVGVRSERKVCDAFSSTSIPGYLVNGALLGAGGDLDHCYVTDWGVIVMETKTGFGKVMRSPSGGIQVGKRTIPGNAVGQVCRQAEAVARKFPNLPISRVVVIPDGYGSHQVQIEGHVVTVTGLNDLVGSLSRHLAFSFNLDDATQRHIVKWLRSGH